MAAGKHIKYNKIVGPTIFAISEKWEPVKHSCLRSYLALMVVS